MTQLLLLVFIAAMLFVVWLFRRRPKHRAEEEYPEHPPTASSDIADKTNKAINEVDRRADSEAFGETEVEFGKDGMEKPEKDPHQADDFTQTQSDSDASFQQEAELTISVEINGAKLLMGEQAGSSELLPPADSDHVLSPPSSKVSEENEKPSADIGRCSSNDQYPPSKPIVSTITATHSLSKYLQAEHTAQEAATVLTAATFPNDELPQTNADAEQALPQRAEESDDQDTGKAQLRYRPPSQKPTRPTTQRPVNQESERATLSEVPLEIRVRLTFDRLGFCEIGLLPGRTPELDNEVAVKFRGTALYLVAQEDWYQDLQFENIGDHLRQGIELKGLLADHRRARWLLTGRDVYVLASHPRASGFISATRLVLGRSHVVLCVVELLQQVEALLNEAGCQGYTKLDESHGLPSGWVGLRGVSPTKAMSLDSGSDPFYAIKPAPDIEIELEGGVWLHNSVWLAGYPPRIKLFGQSNGAVKVLIDGKEAQHTAEGSLVVNGYDLSGKHSVYCEGLSCSRSYSIEEPPDSWQEWPAYRFGQADICGPLVQLTTEAASSRAFTVPMSNPLLLGAEPGQIFRCSSRTVARWKGFVPFDVVWALPAQPLICDKKIACIFQYSDAPISLPINPTKPVLIWCKAILDASRKGLRVENGSPDSSDLWGEYKKAARIIWRSSR